MQPSQGSSPASANAHDALRKVAQRGDHLIEHLSRILSTSSGTETVLQTLQYTLLVVHTQLTRLQAWRSRALVLSIAQKASASLSPGEAVLAILRSPRNDGKLTQVIAGSKALSDLVSDFRIFTRLWGLLDIYKWAKSTWYKPPEDKLIRAAVWTQVLAGVGFQWYENVAYLAMKGVLRGESFNERQQAKWWEWSSRFWVVHIVLEAMCLLRKWRLEHIATSRSSDGGSDGDGEPNDKRIAPRSGPGDAVWRKMMTVNAAWAPIATHYSWEPGFLSEDWVGLFGLVACAFGFADVWSSPAR